MGRGKVTPFTLLAGLFHVSWCLERSSGCEQGCVTDLVLAGYKERGGRSSLPLLAGGEVISGMSPCISWNSLGFLSHPSPLRMLCSCVTWSGNFIICLGTMPHFQEGLKLNQWIRTKCKKNLVGPIFLLLEKKNLGIFSLCPVSRSCSSPFDQSCMSCTAFSVAERPRSDSY